MTLPELNAHVKQQVDNVRIFETPDTVTTLLMIVGEDGAIYYGATAPPKSDKDLAKVYRKMAAALENGDNITWD